MCHIEQLSDELLRIKKSIEIALENASVGPENTVLILDKKYISGYNLNQHGHPASTGNENAIELAEHPAQAQIFTEKKALEIVQQSNGAIISLYVESQQAWLKTQLDITKRSLKNTEQYLIAA